METKSNNSIIDNIIYVVIAILLVLVMVYAGIFVGLKLIFAFLYVFVLPGFAVTLIIWKRGEIDKYLRFLFAVVFSIIFVSLVEFYLSILFGVKIEKVNVYIIILSIFIIAISIAMIKDFISEKKKK